MAFIHTLELKLAKKSSTIFLNEYKKPIDECVKEYNDTSSKAANKKNIELLELTNKTILIRFSSEAELQTVGKALRYFSQLILSKIPSFSNTITSSGQLFRINEIGLPISGNENPEIQLKIREIDDSTLIKSLIDYVCKNKDTNTSIYIKKQKAIEQMKQIALEAGLIDIKE